MSKIKNLKKITFIAVCALLIITVVCGVLLMPLFDTEVVRYNLISGKQKVANYNNEFVPYVLADDSILCVNEMNGAVVITDKEGKTVFNSHSESAVKSKLACVIAFTLRDKKGNSYVMNSLSNDKCNVTFEISTEKKNDVTITYSFSQVASGDFTQVIPVKISEENGGIKASVDMKQVQLKEGFCVEKISILPGLFSVRQPKGKCFYTIPDGCGAEIDLTTVAEKAWSQNLDVYGSDITFGEYSQGATLPCFSLTKNNAMLTAIIEDGDAISSLSVKRNKKTGGDLYNSFVVTPYGRVDGKLVKGQSYDGVVSQVYYLTTSGDRNYNTVSLLLKDNLTQRGYLPSEMSDAFVDYPFFITVIGSENGRNNDVYTNFENAAEMVALLKSRGVRCIALRFAGAGKNGLNTGAGRSNNISEVLGGEKAYERLCKISSEKNSSVWYDINLAVTPSKNGKNKNDIYKEFREYLAKEYVNSYTGTYDFAYSNISDIYKFVSELESANVCINDLSKFLYTDIVGGVNRQVALSNLKEKIQVLGVSGNLMLAKPAVYLMNQATAIHTVTQSVSVFEKNDVIVVPLLQMVLHGSVYYGSEPINLFEDSADAVLKAVEYGASPSFVFTHDNCPVLDYGVYATQTAKFYAFAKRMLPLMDMEMTSHEQVVSGVYKITYDYSKVVYVNYNPSVVEVNGILVSAKDFVII